PWTFAGAYYHWSQDAYVAAGGAVCSTNGSGIKSSNCAGDVNQGSFVVDYAFNKHFDVYAGLTYSDINGGLANGFYKETSSNTESNTAVATGMRLKF
ncbi:MAG: hypothetical protein WA384_12835, partial [Rhodomicrobium sp.]